MLADNFISYPKKAPYLFMVGDVKQSIYRFRGATISAFKRLNATPDKWEEHTINTNYRTDSRLLEIMDEIFQGMGASAWLPYTYDADHLVSNLNGGANEEELFECVPFCLIYKSGFFCSGGHFRSGLCIKFSLTC